MKSHSSSNKYLCILLCHRPSSPDLRRPAPLPAGGQVLQEVWMCLCTSYVWAAVILMLPGFPISCRLTSSPFAALQIDVSQPNVGSGADARPGGGRCGPEPDQAAAGSRRRLHQNPKPKSQTPHIRQGWLDTWHWMKPSRGWMEELEELARDNLPAVSCLHQS